MKRTIGILLLAAVSVAFLCNTVFAVPSLQFDILGGKYNNTDDDIVATSQSFALYAYLIPDKKALLSDTYYVSIALIPNLLPTDLGFFEFNGTSYGDTNLTYGTPSGLAKHGVFPTYYTEISFSFNSGNYSKIYNTEDSAGQGPQTWTSGDKMYYVKFDVDTSLLNTGYKIHFDLYNKKEGKADQSAPFSHDATSDNGGKQVPEPTTVMLMGFGLLGLMGIAKFTVKC